MLNRTHTREEFEEYPYVPLKLWVASLTGEERNDPGLWPAYITVHVWNDTSIIQETLTAPDFTSIDLDKLAAFLARHSGHWSQSADERKAKWIQVVSTHCWDSNFAPFARLAKHLGTLTREPPGKAVYGICPHGLPPICWPCARLVEYDNVTEIRLQDRSNTAHLFLNNDNAIVSIGSNWFRTASMVLERAFTIPGEKESLEENNAAFVVCQCLMVVAAEYNKLLRRAPVLHQQRELRDRNALLSQVLDICGSLLKQQEGLKDGARNWLTQDIRMRLTMASLWLAKAVRGNEEQLSYTRAELEDDILNAIKEGNRIATEQGRITANQARTSAVQSYSTIILNMPLATLGAMTFLCLPFAMTASYFGMNVPEQATNKLWKFWLSFGVATVIFFIIGGLLIYLAVIHGKKIHDYAIKLLDTGNKMANLGPSEKKSDIANPFEHRSYVAVEEHSQPILSAPTQWGRVIDKLRQRKPKRGDVEQATGDDTRATGAVELSVRDNDV